MDNIKDDTHWHDLCAIDEIIPNTGVAGLIKGQQIAVFRLSPNNTVYAIANFDPNSNAAVLSRGLVGNLGERIVVASPIYKQHFDLMTGECLESPEHSVAAYAARLIDGRVQVAL